MLSLLTSLSLARICQKHEKLHAPKYARIQMFACACICVCEPVCIYFDSCCLLSLSLPHAQWLLAVVSFKLILAFFMCLHSRRLVSSRWRPRPAFSSRCLCVCVYRYQYRLRCIRALVCEDMHVCVCWIESDRIEAGAIEISVVLYKWSTCSYTHAHTYTHTHTQTYHTCVPTLSQCVHHVFCLFRLYLWVFPLTQLSYVCFDFCFRVELTTFPGTRAKGRA